MLCLPSARDRGRPHRAGRGLARLLGAGAALTALGLGISSLTAEPLAPVDASRLAVHAEGGDAVLARAAADSTSMLSTDATAFSVATFNVLGSQHTRGRSDYASGRKRARGAARLITRKGIGVIGLQEVQPDQLRMLSKKLGDYDLWPGTQLGAGSLRLQIAWNRAVFTLRDSGWIDTPFDRQVRPMPWVELEHRGTGRTLFVIDTHNSPRRMEAERDAATQQQLALINQLRASRKAVFFLGDMNERREIFCQVVSKTSLRAPQGGSARSKRDCTPPSRMRIDWIFGAGPISFTDYQTFDGPAVRRASDHDFYRATVTVRPRRS